MQWLLFYVSPQQNCNFKRFHFKSFFLQKILILRRENMPPPWALPAMPLQAQSPPRTPPHNTRGEIFIFSWWIFPQYLAFLINIPTTLKVLSFLMTKYLVISLFLSPSFSGLVFSSWWSCIWFVFCDQISGVGILLAFSNSSLALILTNL